MGQERRRAVNKPPPYLVMALASEISMPMSSIANRDPLCQSRTMAWRWADQVGQRGHLGANTPPHANTAPPCPN